MDERFKRNMSWNKQISMRIMRRYVALWIFIIASIANAWAQYDIQVELRGLSCDENLILAYRTGEKQYVQDSSICKNGIFHFAGNNNLPTGNYVVILPDQRFFDIIVSENEDQTKYVFRTDTNLYADDIQVEGSMENKVFLGLRAFSALQNAAKDYLVSGMSADTDEVKKQEVKKKIEVLANNIGQERDRLIAQYPELFVSKLLKASVEVTIPDAPEGMEREEARKYKYDWIRKHYFDNIDLTEKGLIRTEEYEMAIKRYFDKYAPRDVDTAIAMVDAFLEKVKTEGSIEQYRFSTHLMIRHFEKVKRMCYDRVVWHMTQNYFCAGKADWVSEAYRQKLCDYSADREHTLCGRRAPDINMPDTSFTNRVQLHGIDKAATILVFWDIDCMHCKMEFPHLSKIYDTLTVNREELEIYAVYIKKDYEAWKNFVAKNKYNFINVANVLEDDNYNEKYKIHATPQIFVLDRDKNIVYKDINVSDIPKVLNHLVNQEKGEE